jgi:hypothetical protein
MNNAKPEVLTVILKNIKVFSDVSHCQPVAR